MQKLSLEERVRTASNLVIRTAVYLDIWSLYHGPTRAGLLDTMNRFPSFFAFEEHAHRVSFIVHAAALFEKADTINLARLAKELHEAELLSRAAALEVERLIGSVKDVTTGVHTVRSNAIAHRSPSLGFDDAFRKAQLTPNKLERLMEVAFQAVNLLSEACGQEQAVRNETPVREARLMLSSLHPAA